jgi:hypothetical protein
MLFSHRAMFVLTALLAASAAADVPRQFNYQGKLAGYNDEVVSLTVSLWNVSSGGTALFTETHSSVALHDGVFSIRVGAQTAAGVPSTVALPPLFAGLAVNGGAELTPRTRLVSVPFAYRALGAEMLFIPDTSTAAVTVLSGGNVGVNQTSPISNLHVTGATPLANLDVADLGTDQVVIDGGQAWLGLYSDEVGAPGSGISLAEINSTTGALTKWSLVQRTSGNGGDLSITYGSDPAGNANARFLQVKPTGDICVGVDNPSAKLHVKATGSTQGVAPAGLRVASEFPSGTSGTSTEYIQFEGNEIIAKKDNAFSTLELQKGGGQVNIGNLLVDSPKLTVSRDFQFVSDDDLQFEDVLIHDPANAWLGLYSDSLGNVGSGITFCEYGATRYKWGMYARTTDNVGDFVVTFGTDVNPTANEKMFQIDRDGTTKVKVLEILGADVAERFPTTDKVEAGHVVMIDAANAGQLCLARGAYNSKVAGVVSGAGNLPVGAVLGNLPGTEKGQSPPIALSGRVWTWCDAGEFAIEPGDLLTTSDTPGHAMKATDADRRGGAVIGKAMSSLAAGQRGLVLVLVNLQ